MTNTKAQTEKRYAWFVCRAKGLVGDVLLSIKDGATGTDEEFAEQGRMRAARRFKRDKELHPCTKVEVEFQGIESAATEARNG